MCNILPKDYKTCEQRIMLNLLEKCKKIIVFQSMSKICQKNSSFSFSFFNSLNKRSFIDRLLLEIPTWDSKGRFWWFHRLSFVRITQQSAFMTFRSLISQHHFPLSSWNFCNCPCILCLLSSSMLLLFYWFPRNSVHMLECVQY